jgi:uncharacterized repeat protein (TIGR04138 family)
MNGGEATVRYYCYVHAIAAGLLEGPLAFLAADAAKTGYATNGVVFVLEALSQRGCVTEVDRQRSLWRIATPVKTAEKFCIAVRHGAIERFDLEEHLVLKHWNLGRGEDIGLVLSRLTETGILTLEEEQNAQVLKDLRSLRRELLTFPYDGY